MPTRGTAEVGLGATVAIDDQGGGLVGNGTFVDMVNVDSLGVPATKLGTVESKTLDIANRTLNRIPGIFDPGSGLVITWEMVNANTTGNSVIGQYARMEALRASVLGHSFRFSIPNDNTTNANITQTAFVVQNEIQPVTSDGKTMVNTVLDLSGAPT